MRCFWCSKPIRKSFYEYGNVRIHYDCMGAVNKAAQEVVEGLFNAKLVMQPPAKRR